MVNIPGASIPQRARRSVSDVQSTFGRGDEHSDSVHKHYGDTDHASENTHQGFGAEHYEGTDFHAAGVQHGRSLAHPSQTTAASAAGIGGGAAAAGQARPAAGSIHAGEQPPTFIQGQQHAQQRGFAQQPSEPGYGRQASSSQGSHFPQQPQQQQQQASDAQPQQGFTQQRPSYGDEGQRAAQSAKKGAQGRKKSFMGRVHEKLSSL
ncbi:hypothetical protein KEM52_000771 [Ascosphaera acerosa]|nr:hypothetical protein KEM52_000771 [Ascosphaera acerosa]